MRFRLGRILSKSDLERISEDCVCDYGLCQATGLENPLGKLFRQAISALAPASAGAEDLIRSRHRPQNLENNRCLLVHQHTCG